MDKQIDENLRRAYREVVQEEVPERFIRLLEELRQQDAAENTTKPAGNSKEAK